MAITSEGLTSYSQPLLNLCLMQRIMDTVMSPGGQQRFVASLVKLKLRLPHCDSGAEKVPRGA